ncbi:Membrane protein implicated in regulation of membrane protease activity [Paenibacillus sp. UNCCL117]|uniref:NfeD family protein n=1 Tax=unclassified Paenibacillus TaxID=185978 RepID=UPI0008801413|nr:MULTISPECIES: NfeD family protein [unclassified Paenibacillus]SDD72270.1 Membrane protein implicated in regulation of membrane protease activity [Paenibacillus sp. cl123]SFW45694.1 Membrane protein implicated in regulation of membrane protease activity [Paenibacillus sp. UNCCL117]
MELWAIWLIIAGVLLIAEMMTLTFYLLWIAVGAAVAAAMAWLWPGLVIWQVFAGCIVVLVLTIFTKPITRRFRSSGSYRDAVDELVGKTGVVLEPIEPGAQGLVRVGSEMWSARAEERIAEGETVTVQARSSTHLFVQKAKGDG